MSVSLALPELAQTSAVWPRRWALLCALSAVPLVLFGGSVTTLGAGMAVDGWLIAEGHFLLFFPVEKWFRDTPTFVEHTHRLFGGLVGACACACVVATWLGDASATARRCAIGAFLLVCLQGLLGGLRVLADDPQLAFLHGGLAQVVFAGLWLNVVLVSPQWRESQPASAGPARVSFARAARVALGVVLAQVFVGAWYRHGLRPAPVVSSDARLLLHALGAVAVLAAAATVVKRGTALRAGGGELPGSLALALRLLPALLLVQLVLGGLAWAGFRPGAIGPAEWTLSIAHVLGGAVLTAALSVCALWGSRFARTAPAGAVAAEVAR